ncbi:hypothetical protein P5673_019215 [Acropora cervicornis]|uniref:THAP-type domain-containing protein n=1 Tax=Acropora cervicornis TaxID=6130 RepID=A0AAD9V248_ACRCE|nr:hypothetical protein P5673_019215 [Acropora cervicornis]
MPDRCVVAGCCNVPNSEKGIDLTKFPFFGDDRNMAKARRRKWTEFYSLEQASIFANEIISVATALTKASIGIKYTVHCIFDEFTSAKASVVEQKPEGLSFMLCNLDKDDKSKTCEKTIDTCFGFRAGKCNFNVEDDTSITNVSFSETVIVFNHAMDITYSFEPTKNS